MIGEIKKNIEEVYVRGNKKLFVAKCRKEIDFLCDFLELLKSNFLHMDIDTDSNEPAIEIRFDVNRFAFNGGEIKYTSILSLNKIVDYFYLQHEFSLDNPDPDSMTYYLDSFSDQAYCKKQFDLDDMIVKYLSSKGYKRLYYYDMEEVFIGEISLQNPDDINQITVNNALFMDILNLCCSDKE